MDIPRRRRGATTRTFERSRPARAPLRYIYVVAELTTIANVYATFVGKSTEGDDSKVYTTKVAAIVVIFTWSYTCLAGLPASILTDKFQGVTIMAFVIMLLVAALTLKSNEVSKKEFNDATGWFAKGGEAFVTLWIAIISASLFHQGTWQRVFAAKSDRDMRIGFAVGGMMVTVLMMFFGVMGMIAYVCERGDLVRRVRGERRGRPRG